MSGSSGGGSSGKVSWPDWISERHRDGADFMLASLQSTLNPFIDVMPSDPHEQYTWMSGELSNYQDILNNFDPSAGWEAAIDRVAIKYDQAILAPALRQEAMSHIVKYSKAELDANILPAFRAGMRDINAVQTSAFVIGEAIINGFFLHGIQEVGAKYILDQFDKRTSAVLGTAGKLLEPEITKLQAWENYSKVANDFNRLMLVANKEYVDSQLDIDEAEARWELEKWNNYGNFIASMNGGTVHTTGRKPSSSQSALGGAFSGASAGLSMTGNWWGAAGGAVLGAGAAMMNR